MRRAALAMLGLAGMVVGCYQEADPEIYAQAEVLMGERRFDEAAPLIKRYLIDHPDDAGAHTQLALALVEAGEPEGAVPHYDAALALRPDDVSIHVARGQALQAVGRNRDAIESYEAALALHPHGVSLLNNVAWLLATTPGVGPEGRARAVLLAARAADLTDHGNPDVLDTLSQAQASAGLTEEARETARRVQEQRER